MYADLCEVLHCQHTRSQTSMFGRVILVVEAVNHREVRSCLIDGEVVCCDEKGGAAFQLLRHRRNEPRAFLYVFDLLELNGTGLRREPIEVRKATAGEHPAREPASLPRLFALRLGPLDHVHMPAVDALKQQDRWEFVVEPGQLPGELHARRATTTDQPRLWLVIHVRIIGVRECRRGTGKYRTPRVGRSHFGGGGSGSRSAVPTYPQPPHKWTTSPDSGRTGGSLRASRIASPHWGHRGADSGSFRTSIELSEHDGHCMQPSAECISAHAARQPNTAAPRAEKLVLGLVLLASHGPNEGGTAPLCSSTPARWGWRGLSRSGVALPVWQVAGLAKVQESGCAGGEA